MTLPVKSSDLKLLRDTTVPGKVDKIEGHSLIADTEIVRLTWMFAKKTIADAISGEVVIDPADGHRQEATVDGNITSLTCALSEATPSVVLELTAEAAYTLDLTGWETDEGVPFDLKSGKSILLLSLSADGVTKYAFLVGQEVA